MKRCPLCEGSRHYKLIDGRLKCWVYGQRFSWRSAWNFVRLLIARKFYLSGVRDQGGLTSSKDFPSSLNLKVLIRALKKCFDPFSS